MSHGAQLSLFLLISFIPQKIILFQHCKQWYLGVRRFLYVRDDQVITELTYPQMAKWYSTFVIFSEFNSVALSYPKSQNMARLLNFCYLTFIKLFNVRKRFVCTPYVSGCNTELKGSIVYVISFYGLLLLVLPISI